MGVRRNFSRGWQRSAWMTKKVIHCKRKICPPADAHVHLIEKNIRPFWPNGLKFFRTFLKKFVDNRQMCPPKNRSYDWCKQLYDYVPIFQIVDILADCYFLFITKCLRQELWTILSIAMALHFATQVIFSLPHPLPCYCYWLKKFDGLKWSDYYECVGLFWGRCAMKVVSFECGLFWIWSVLNKVCFEGGLLWMWSVLNVV